MKSYIFASLRIAYHITIVEIAKTRDYNGCRFAAVTI